MAIFIAVIAYLLVGVLFVRPSKALYNLADPRVGDAVPIVVFWPLYLLMCATDVSIPKKWIVPPAAPRDCATSSVEAARNKSNEKGTL